MFMQAFSGDHESLHDDDPAAEAAQARRLGVVARRAISICTRSTSRATPTIRKRFVDPDGYQAKIQLYEKLFGAQLKKEQEAKAQ